MKETITIKEIARRLRISPSTVSRALQDNPRISQKTREAVRALAGQLKYFPSTTARNLRSGKTGVFAMVLPEIRENFFSEVVNGVEELAFSHQYTVALYQSHDLFEREKQILAVLASNRVDGIMLSVAKESQQFQHVQDLIDRGIPVVLFDRIPPKIEAHQVGCNIEKGAYDATKWLAHHGFRRIALLKGPNCCYRRIGLMRCWPLMIMWPWMRCRFAEGRVCASMKIFRSSVLPTYHSIPIWSIRHWLPLSSIPIRSG
jgi:LacI family repressor for deo operon, udp, cdd, tsx, nupC, and nupG